MARNVSLDFRAVDFVTEQHLAVRAWRAYAEVRFVNRHGAPVSFDCFIDPGAPFSVIPYALWHGLDLQWTRLGSTLRRSSGQPTRALHWQGIPCDLGSTILHLLDLDLGIRTGGHHVVAKFPQRHPAQTTESAAILGMNFLTDNEIRLVLDGTGGILQGTLGVPQP